MMLKNTKLYFCFGKREAEYVIREDMFNNTKVPRTHIITMKDFFDNIEEAMEFTNEYGGSIHECEFVKEIYLSDKKFKALEK